MNRAYSLFEIKAVDDDQRIITGIATTPTPDRAGDVVEPQGAEYTLPLPLLWQHDSGQPIGFVTSAKVTAKGIEIIAQIAKDVSAQIDQAWTLIKSGLVRGLSIGFRALDTEQIPNSWGVVFNKWEWLELSAVTIPANAEASIQTVKSLDTEIRAEAGIKDEVREEKGDAPPPAVRKDVHVAKLADPARVRAKPFVIRDIRHLTDA
jgi:HK97 family phage prohead protease